MLANIAIFASFMLSTSGITRMEQKASVFLTWNRQQLFFRFKISNLSRTESNVYALRSKSVPKRNASLKEWCPRAERKAVHFSFVLKGCFPNKIPTCPEQKAIYMPFILKGCAQASKQNTSL